MTKSEKLEDDQISIESMEECPPSATKRPNNLAVEKDSVQGRAQDLLDEIDRELDDVEAAFLIAKDKAKKKDEDVDRDLERPKSPNTTQQTFFSRSHHSDGSGKSPRWGKSGSPGFDPPSKGSTLGRTSRLGASSGSEVSD